MPKALICIVVFLLFIFSSAHSETIQLKSGRTIEGEIVERGADYIRLDLRGVVLTYYLDEIETIDGRPSAEEKESLSTSPASPHTPRLDRAELKKRIGTQLRELHYPEHTHLALKRELLAFFERIDLPALQSKAQLAKDNPDKLKELAEEIGAIFEREGFLDAESPRPLIRLLVDSFGNDDMLAVIEQSPLSQEEKEVDKRILYACSVISQLSGITLNSMGLAVKTLNSTSSLPEGGHVASYIQLNSREILLVDFLNLYFEIIDLDYWYKQEGEYLALRPQHRLSPERMLEITRRLQQGIVPTQTREILNLLFLTLNLTDHYSASASIYDNRAEAYRRKGDLNQAISDFNQALRINPNSVAYNNRGLAYADQGNLPQATADYNQALRINPNLAGAYNNRGNAYVEQGNLSQAISDYNQSLRINPNFALAYNNRGLAYHHQGNLPQAISDYNQALAINPNYSDAYNNRGNVYCEKGNLNQAIHDFSQALRINPNDAMAYNNRAIAYFYQGDYARAWEDVRRAQELDHQVNPEFPA